jgi:hypothetical protein
VVRAAVKKKAPPRRGLGKPVVSRNSYDGRATPRTGDALRFERISSATSARRFIDDGLRVDP